jgi:hypothetical protein
VGVNPDPRRIRVSGIFEGRSIGKEFELRQVVIDGACLTVK